MNCQSFRKSAVTHLFQFIISNKNPFWPRKKRKIENILIIELIFNYWFLALLNYFNDWFESHYASTLFLKVNFMAPKRSFNLTDIP
jgi:hypothetical protein